VIFLADESVNHRFITWLRDQNLEVLAISETNSGINDIEVAKISKSLNAILLTEDKDFGTLVFAENLKNLTVILLRYNKIEEEKIKSNLLTAIQKLANSEGYFYVTITALKIRITML